MDQSTAATERQSDMALQLEQYAQRQKESETQRAMLAQRLQTLQVRMA